MTQFNNTLDEDWDYDNTSSTTRDIPSRLTQTPSEQIGLYHMAQSLSREIVREYVGQNVAKLTHLSEEDKKFVLKGATRIINNAECTEELRLLIMELL